MVGKKRSSFLDLILRLKGFDCYAQGLLSFQYHTHVFTVAPIIPATLDSSHFLEPTTPHSPPEGLCMCCSFCLNALLLNSRLPWFFHLADTHPAPEFTLNITASGRPLLTSPTKLGPHDVTLALYIFPLQPTLRL